MADRLTLPHQEMTVRSATPERSYAAGETFAIPRGTPHTMFNGGDDEARVIWTTTPALDTLGWFQTLATAQRTGDYTALGEAVQVHAREIRFV